MPETPFHRFRRALAFLSVIPKGNLLPGPLAPSTLRRVLAFLSVIPEGNLLLGRQQSKFRRAFAFLSVIPKGNLLPARSPRARVAQLAALALIILFLGAAEPEHRFDKMGHEMICTCGCSQILVECNHVGCPVSPVMIGELRDQIDKGGPDNLILNWFASKYGATVLAAPMRGGFDNVAWITPLAVFFLATVGVAFLVTVWKKRNPPPPPPGGPRSGPINDLLRARIRQETQY